MSDWVTGLHRDVQDAARQLLAEGWQYDRTSRKSHPRMSWPATGERISLPSTPSDRRSVPNCIAAARRISGIRPEAHAGPSFKRVRVAPLDLKAARRESAKHADQVEGLYAELVRIEDEIRLLHPVRNQFECLRLARRYQFLVSRLRALHAPPPPEMTA